jgi:predicted acetyltransferase
MQLIKPTKKYEQSWLEGIAEFEAEKRNGFWNIPDKPTDIDSYIQRCMDHEQGKNLPDYWVPATTYWLIDNDEFVGHVNIRHKLNDQLEKIGGHIGYAIRPSKRKKGYGTKILESALSKAKERGFPKVMVTCDTDNIASRKIIEKHGGKLIDSNPKEDGTPVNRYWITL